MNNPPVIRTPEKINTLHTKYRVVTVCAGLMKNTTVYFFAYFLFIFLINTGLPDYRTTGLSSVSEIFQLIGNRGTDITRGGATGSRNHACEKFQLITAGGGIKRNVSV